MIEIIMQDDCNDTLSKFDGIILSELSIVVGYIVFSEKEDFFSHKDE